MAYAVSSECPFCHTKILGLSPDSKEEATARMNYHYNKHVSVCLKKPDQKLILKQK